MWQDRRTAPRCDQLKAQGHEPLIRRRTGLVIDPYFSATKIAWLLENVDGLRQRAREGRAVFGTIDSWLIFKLSGELVTEASNASRTMLFDINECRWDDELMELFGVAEAKLGEVRSSSGPIATTNPDAFHGHSVTIAGVAGDQQAALFGQTCFEQGLGKNTYGTGSFLLFNAGHAPPEPTTGLLGTVAWGIERRFTYAVEAAIFVTGAAVQWLRDGLRVIDDAAETAAPRRLDRRQRRRLFRPGVDRARLAVLGSVRARDDHRADPRLDQGAPGARDARVDRLPDRRRRPARSRAPAVSGSPSSAPTAVPPPTPG